MRYLPSLSKEEPAVGGGGDNPADEIRTARTSDPEKEAIDHDETLRAAVVHHGDPAIERRVVRKLDWRLVPIVMGLCE